MPFHFVMGDILQAPTAAIVNPVNCVGVMGAGLALQFKHTFPEIMDQYEQACKARTLKLGTVLTDHVPGRKPPYIIHFPTKHHYRDKSDLKSIQAGLRALQVVIDLKKIESIALPALGCGLGGLPWPRVRQQIEFMLRGDIPVYVYKPGE